MYFYRLTEKLKKVLFHCFQLNCILTTDSVDIIFFLSFFSACLLNKTCPRLFALFKIESLLIQRSNPSTGGINLARETQNDKHFLLTISALYII